ncbi:HEAT repeat domain-containing protein [Candidatus Micrarchaeota archaeon]|nr:HEAT repeat domain-containing protein [Candidatus Micrarchaeota archaeon]
MNRKQQRIETLVRRLASSKSFGYNDAMVELHRKGEEAVPALVEALKSENKGVRTRAAWTLSEISEPAVPALVELLEKESATASERFTAKWALAKIGMPVVEIMSARVRETRDERLREAMMEVIGRTVANSARRPNRETCGRLAFLQPFHTAARQQIKRLVV